MEDVKIGKIQAQEFAKAIFADIDVYVQTHQEEFEKFLEEEQKQAEAKYSNIA